MTSPSVVILTEPANCELADGPLLLEALREVQQLSREGVTVSQAFCDNPAAAAEFIDAYAKAYPGLELESADLPLPERLYSMLVDGRLAPLPNLNPTADGTKVDVGGALNPVVVLSLGKPDGLMQALQGSRSVSNSISVIEIAPDTEERNVPTSVAAAVAGHGIAATPWSLETASVGSRHAEEDAVFVSEEEGNAPLRLESAEFSPDYIESDTNREQARDSVPASIVVDITPIGATGDGDVGSSARADAVVAGSVSATTSTSQPDSAGPIAAPPPEPIVAPPSEPSAAPASEPIPAPPPEPILAPEPELMTALPPEPIAATEAGPIATSAPELAATSTPVQIAASAPELIAAPGPDAIAAPGPITASGPILTAAPEPIVAPLPEPIAGPEPNSVPAPEPIVATAPGPTVAPPLEPIAAPEPERIAAIASDPIVAAAPESSAATTAEPITASTPEPSTTSGPELTVAAAPYPMVAPALEPIAAPEPIAATTPEPATISESTNPFPDGSADAPNNAPPDERSADVAPSSDEPNYIVGPDTSVAEPKAIEPDDEDLGGERSSFGDLDEDVVYAPTGTFTPEDDMFYPLPAAAAPDADTLGDFLQIDMADDIVDLEAIASSGVADVPEADAFGGVLEMSMAGDIVDLEALFSSGAAAAPGTTEPFDPIMMKPPGPDDHGGHDGFGPQRQDVDLGHRDLPGSDQDTDQHETIIPVHDLDI